MKVLIIMSGFFPGKKFGGPPVSVNNFCSLLLNYAECFILTLNHDMGDINPYEDIHNGWNVRTNCKIKYVSDIEYNINTFRKVINEVTPDILYLQGLFQKCIVPSLVIAKKEKLQVLLAPRGELCAGAFKKKYKKIPYIIILRMMRLLSSVEFQSTSEEETIAIHKYLKCAHDKIHSLANVPSVCEKNFSYSKKEKGSAKFVFLSRIHPKKNLISAIKFFEEIKGNVVFDIYGPIEDKEYWVKCQHMISKLPQNIHVEYQGCVNHDEVHKVLSEHDAFLFPTWSENYGHVIVEALMAGCFVIISDKTPWNDINENRCGWAIELTDTISFIKVIQQVVDMNVFEQEEKRTLIFEYLEKKLQIDELRTNYIKVLHNLVSRKKEE